VFRDSVKSAGKNYHHRNRLGDQQSGGPSSRVKDRGGKLSKKSWGLLGQLQNTNKRKVLSAKKTVDKGTWENKKLAGGFGEDTGVDFPRARGSQ